VRVRDAERLDDAVVDGDAEVAGSRRDDHVLILPRLVSTARRRERESRRVGREGDDR
jgi:hypothetical protein